jgi:hypothetical protein
MKVPGLLRRGWALADADPEPAEPGTLMPWVASSA